MTAMCALTMCILCLTGCSWLQLDNAKYYMLIVPERYLTNLNVSVADTTNYYVELKTALENISEEAAIKKLYSSKLYAVLEKEETKVWQYSTHMLYSLFEQEEKNGDIQFPDV